MELKGNWRLVIVFDYDLVEDPVEVMADDFLEDHVLQFLWQRLDSRLEATEVSELECLLTTPECQFECSSASLELPNTHGPRYEDDSSDYGAEQGAEQGAEYDTENLQTFVCHSSRVVVYGIKGDWKVNLLEAWVAVGRITCCG